MIGAASNKPTNLLAGSLQYPNHANAPDGVRSWVVKDPERGSAHRHIIHPPCAAESDCAGVFDRITATESRQY